MQEEDWKNFIKEAKENYKKIGSVPCPAFGGELVYFNKHGWNHLLRKGRLPRDIEERHKRIRLLKYAPQIIAIVRNLSDNKETIRDNSHANFWAAHQKVDGLRIRIIIRQRNNGVKHFFSIMEEESR